MPAIRPIVMFPDFKGRATSSYNTPGGFVDRVRTAVPDAILCPVLNGLPPEELDALANKLRKQSIASVVSAGPRGLVDALIAGYTRATGHADENPIVRLDTAEHPPEFAKLLLEEAEKIDGMVIGDLDFVNDHLVPGTVDEFAHIDLFPELYRQTTGGKLELSCAHGFQAFGSRAVCEKALAEATTILRHLEDNLLKTVTWGFDGAMALGAIAANVPVKIVKVPSERIRNRSREKIAAQFSAALYMCQTFSRLYPLATKRNH